MKYYSLKNILSRNALYNVIFGERSNGKTYSVLQYAIKNYAETGKQLAIVRRWSEDFVGKRGQSMFNALVTNNEVAKATHNEWTDIYYWSSRWYFCKYDDKGVRVVDPVPMAYGFSITSQEHDKSTYYPNITTILFDEFISREAYLPDEFVLFCNTLSTIIRERTDVKVFMLGNTVNKYCPYFAEMGLKHVREMKEGDIDVYSYGSTDLKVAVEYCKPNAQGKPSDVYFAFDNPKLNMITGGAWEIAVYPHCPVKFRPKNILFTYFIQFEGDTLQCEVVSVEDVCFTFIHLKTTELKDTDNDLIFTTEYSPRYNYRRKITKPQTDLEKKIVSHFINDKVFYATNEVGEIVRNYLLWCGKKV